jgi:hypothetical protein
MGDTKTAGSRNFLDLTELTGNRRKLHNKDRHILCSKPDTSREKIENLEKIWKYKSQLATL